MALMDVVSEPFTGRLTAQVGRLGSKVGSRLALFCISLHELGALSQWQ